MARYQQVRLSQRPLTSFPEALLASSQTLMRKKSPFRNVSTREKKNWQPNLEGRDLTRLNRPLDGSAVNWLIKVFFFAKSVHITHVLPHTAQLGITLRMHLLEGPIKETVLIRMRRTERRREKSLSPGGIRTHHIMRIEIATLVLYHWATKTDHLLKDLLPNRSSDKSSRSLLSRKTESENYFRLKSNFRSGSQRSNFSQNFVRKASLEADLLVS